MGRPLTLRAEVGQYLPDWRPGTDYRTGVSASRDQGGGALLPADGPPSRTGRGVLLLVALLVILAALVWFFLLRGSDPASVGSSARDGVATVAAALDTAMDPGDLTI